MMRSVMAGIVGSALIASAAMGQDLRVGDAAPRLEHVEWLKGEPVPSYEEGHVYVLDFWATWCGPCIAAMPHLKELQEQYEDDNVHVIGVAIWPRATQTPTGEWLEARGDFVTWRIAEDIDRQTADAYMTAAGQGGIPTVMVVDGSGKLAWIGHPMDEALETVLSKLTSGQEFDAVAFAEEQRKVEAERQRLMQEAMAIMGPLQQAVQDEEWGVAERLADKILALDQEMFSQIAMLKYYVLVKSGDGEAARKWGAQTASTLYADDAGLLNNFAWMIVGPDSEFSPEEQDAELAVTLAEKASALTGGNDADALDTLARAYFVAGHRDKAVETQRRAVEQSDAGPMREQLQSRLEEYEAAVAEREN